MAKCNSSGKGKPPFPMAGGKKDGKGKPMPVKKGGGAK